MWLTIGRCRTVCFAVGKKKSKYIQPRKRTVATPVREMLYQGFTRETTTLTLRKQSRKSGVFRMSLPRVSTAPLTGTMIGVLKGCSQLHGGSGEMS